MTAASASAPGCDSKSGSLRRMREDDEAGSSESVAIVAFNGERGIRRRPTF